MTGTLRFFFALQIALHHFGLGQKPIPYFDGLYPVQCFFVLSGFSIFLILEKSDLDSVGTAFKFFLDRYLRILFLPLLLLTAYLLTHPIPRAWTLSESWWPIIVIQNFTLFGADWAPVFFFDDISGKLQTSLASMTIPTTLINGPTWSLGTEIAFYALVPILALRKVVLPIVLLIASLFVENWVINAAPWEIPMLEHYFFLFHFKFFMLGILSYHLWRLLESQIKRPLRIVLSYGFILMAILISSFHDQQWIIPYVLAASLPFIACRFQKGSTDHLLADLSFTFYVSHTIFYWDTLALFNLPYDSGPAPILELLCISLAFALVLTIFVERPLRSFRRIILRYLP